MAAKDKENKSTGNIVSNIVNHIKASKKKEEDECETKWK